MSAEPVKVEFYEWGSAILTPPEPGDDPAHPTMLLMFSKGSPDDDSKPDRPDLIFAVCGRCLMEHVERAMIEGSGPAPPVV